MSTRLRKLCSLLLAFAFVSGVYRPALACGPFTLTSVFTFTVHPDYPLDEFARGQVGVLQPTYARSYLYAAYRQFNGASFNREEQAALAALWKERLDLGSWRDEPDATKAWLEARKQVAGLNELNDINVYRTREKPDDQEAYLNCHNDAFTSATTTLNERTRKLGANHPSLKAWVEAQDDVFANCSEGERIPAALDANADALLRADRAYQIAAAYFYAARFPEARRAFEEIARNDASPWRSVAPYLAARTLVRQASLGAEAAKTEPLSEAEKLLQKILDDQNMRATHAGARRLLNLVRLRLRPEQRLHELAAEVLRRDAQQTLKQDVLDYTLLLDSFVGEDALVAEGRLKNVPAVVREDDLTDWLVAFQVQDEDALEHSVQRWEKTQTNAWLVAALSKMSGGHPKAASLLAAAERVKTDSAAFPSVVFHSLRLLIEAGREQDARTRLDALLTQERAAFPVSALNLLSSQRMMLARNLEEFLQFAQRTPSAFSYDDDGREIAEATEDVLKDETYKDYARGRKLFDTDAARILNEQFPLALLKQAAQSRTLPDNLRREVAAAAWVRSVLLNDRATGKELAPVVEALAPQLKGYLDAESAAATPDARKFSALYAILKFPGLQPYVASGMGRVTPVQNIDDYRDNWWCDRKIQPATDASPKDDAGNQLKARLLRESTRTPGFLDAAQRALAAQENAKLAALGAAPNYLTRTAIEWANKTPDDPRVPEALHLAVKTTRYGCTDAQSPAFSKAAHQLLHKRYPKSQWAKKTPYWFKNT
jgi:hypothetical protein